MQNFQPLGAHLRKLNIPVGRFSNFHTQVLARLNKVTKDSSSTNISLLKQDMKVEEVVAQAFREKSKTICAIIDSNTHPKARKYEEFASSVISNIIRVIEKSPAIVGYKPKNDPTLINAVAEKLYSWITLCNTADQYSDVIPNKNHKLFLADLLSATRIITSERSETMAQRSFHAGLYILKQFISHANPIEIMRNADQFKALRFGEDVFECNAAISGVLVDCYRTKQFVLGVIEAVKELEKRFPRKNNDKIISEEDELRIGDLGSGPLGFLGIVALLASKRVKVDFHELNPESKILLDTVIDSFGFVHRARTFCSDASECKPEKGFHAIFSETMMEMLVCEPFPLLIQKARKQLIPNGIILPQQVDIKVLPMNMDKPGQYRLIHALNRPDEVHCIDMSKAMGKFEFNAINTVADHVEFRLNLSDIENGRYRFRLSTDVQVFNSLKLKDGDSLISSQTTLFSGDLLHPQSIGIEVNDELRKRGNTIVVKYQFGSKDPQARVYIDK